MRIDAYQKVSQCYQANSAKKAAKSEETSKKDRIDISQAGRDCQAAKRAVESVPDIREDKVRDIQSRMEAGIYQVTSENLADKIMERYFNFPG